jgi:hypothetical protein
MCGDVFCRNTCEHQTTAHLEGTLEGMITKSTIQNDSYEGQDNKNKKKLKQSKFSLKMID